MAGIGIRLNRIFNKHTMGMVVYGSVYSMLATVAPMLLVIGTLLLMYYFLGFSTVGYWDRELFSCSVLYIFIFSLLVASPFNSVLSKYLGDRIFEEKYEDILPCIYTGLALNMSLACLIGIPFYIWEVVVGKVEIYYVFTTFCCYVSLGLCFYQMLYLSVLKLYKKISLFFLIGMTVTFVLSLLMHYILGVSVTYSMLFSLFIGFLLIACLEYGFTKTYFHENSHHYREVFRYFRIYWKLIFTNFFYVLGLYIHNFVFWTKKEMQLILVDTYVCNQPYDMASCIAMFTNLSASVIFIAYIEMHFHDRYQNYTEAVLGGRLKDIRKAKKRMFRMLADQLMRVVQIQFMVSIVIFLLCVIIMPRVGMSGLVMVIYPCLAAGYFVLFLVYTALLFLQYFNDLTGSMLTSMVFCASVFLFSIISKELPNYWYGFGVFAGSLIGWTVAYIRIRWVERHLEAHVFCRGTLLQKVKGPMPSSKVYDLRLGGMLNKKAEDGRKQSILFVMNTMGRAGAERALLELIKMFDPEQFNIYLYVLIPRGELFGEVPDYVKVLNKKIDTGSVLSRRGSVFVAYCLLKSAFGKDSLKKAWQRFAKIKKMKAGQEKKKKVDKILRRMLADGQEGLERSFDLAVAYLEGPATWYVAEKVQAKKKAAFVHVDYSQAGYDKEVDLGCYEKIQQIFTVSNEVKKGFLEVYPEYEDKTEIFFNIINRESILEKSRKDGGFTDSWGGFRILTVGRLNYQKGYDIAIEAAHILKEQGRKFRWYVIGEGDEQKKLQKQIQKAGLKESFILMGAVSNPYPYFRQTDLYVSSSRFEGKSIVIEEAQILGKPIIATRCTAIEEQISHGLDGWIAEQDAKSIADAIAGMMDHPEMCREYGERAAHKYRNEGKEVEKLLKLLEK